MERPKIGPGYRVGKLEVLRPTGERKNGYMVWLCKCGCGGEALLDTRSNRPNRFWAGFVGPSNRNGQMPAYSHLFL